MEDTYETLYDCPECENGKLKEHSKKCPKCGTKLRFCDRNSHLVDESDYDDEISMCHDCEQATLDKF